MAFKDHFSRQAQSYAEYRPHYPEALFSYLAGLASGHTLAWDCATGSGQAALGLALHYRRVLATDASENQVRHALPHDRVHYIVAAAEGAPITAGTVDVITVAQALHWFDYTRFYAEVRRILKSGGVLAAWCYGLFETEPAVDRLIERYYTDIVGPYWPAERRYIEGRYRDLPFPFMELTTPAFSMESRWNLNALVGYLRTWSATQRFQQQRRRDPLDTIAEPLRRAWGHELDTKLIRWPLFLRVGRPGR